MSVPRRFRDVFRAYTPPWLRDRRTANRTAGYRFLWAAIAPLDVAAEVLLQGLRSAWPGVGTPTALPRIGRSRAMIRGQGESDDDYAARLRPWLERHRNSGSMLAIALAIHEYLGNRPRVRIVNRAGTWLTVERDGSVTRHKAARSFPWDDVSHPTRLGYWSDLWLVVYPSPWAVAGRIGDAGAKLGRATGIGHVCAREEYDAVRGLVAQWKGAHSKVRAIIWTSDPGLFDPATLASQPDGQWGAWSDQNDFLRGASHRNITTCRYWEL